MRLKRVYDWDAPQDHWPKRHYDRNTNHPVDSPTPGQDVELRLVPPIKGVIILGARPRQKFPVSLVEQGIFEGWIEIAKGQIVVTGMNHREVYDIVRGPGHWCLLCDSKIPDGGQPVQTEFGRTTRAVEHVRVQHPGQKSPNPENPNGIELLACYDCSREGWKQKAQKDAGAGWRTYWKGLFK